MADAGIPLSTYLIKKKADDKYCPILPDYRPYVDFLRSAPHHPLCPHHHG